MDKRIGRSFLYAGRGYGGGCFPKDVSGLISVAEKYNVKLPIMEASVGINERMPEIIVQKVKKELGEIEGKKVLIDFKNGSCSRRSVKTVIPIE
jgi:UDPglucose 6-dehydrogenase